MATHVPHSPPPWHDPATVVTVLGGVAAAARGAYVAFKRWLRRRERAREFDRALKKAVTVLLDDARATLRIEADQRNDAFDIWADAARRRERLDEARDDFWLAQGKERSAPSGAPTRNEETED